VTNNRYPVPADDTFKTRIAGIPCYIKVTHYREQPADKLALHSDWDYYGCIEFEFIVLDRRGYKADWLKSKLTDVDIPNLISEYVETNQY
jgi:hypothetical protein